MAKHNKNILNEKFKITLLFFCLIPFISTSIEWVDYKASTNTAEYTHTNGDRIQTIGLTYDSLPFYLKITVTPGENTITPLMCVSNSDSNCKDDRIAFGSGGVGDSTSVYLKKEQIDDSDKELFVLVTCEEEKCSYKVKFEGGQAAEINVNSVFSYVVSNENRVMKFQVMGEAQDGSYLTIGVEGSPSVQLNIEVDDPELDFPSYYLDNARIATFPLNSVGNSNILGVFEVRGANPGDYLTLNVHTVVYNTAPDNLLYPNGPTIMGVLSMQEGYFREECFPMSILVSEKYSTVNKYYLTGKIYSKYGLFWLGDKDGMYMDTDEKEITDGLLFHLIENNGEKRSVCFEFSYESIVEMGYVAYSISILEMTKLESIYNYYPPQTLGTVNIRALPRGGIAVFHSGKIETSDKRVTFNMYNRKGVVDMYVTRCSTYPNCIYDKKAIESFNKPKRISRMTMWDFEIDKTYKAIDYDKQVMIVYCKDDDEDNKGYCEFETSFDIAGKQITLVEGEQYSKYVLKEDKGEFRMDFKGGMKIQRLTIDIMIYSGDVSFDVQGFNNKLGKKVKLEDEEIEITHYKYYLSNKIFYHFNFAQLAYDEMDISYKAELNSFFTIKYEINPYNLIQLEEKLVSDESYLVQIDPTTTEKYKKVFLPNYRIKGEQPFLANFFALNCEFQVTRKEKEDSDEEKEISFFDGYAQEIITKDTVGYTSKSYNYTIRITEPDLSNYNHKMCMLYVAGYEAPDTQSKTEIVVAENVNQQVIFNNDFKSIRFLYPHSDPEKDLAIYVNIIDEAYYIVKIYFNSEDNAFKEFTITRSKIYYLSGNDITSRCTRNTLCRVIVEATFDKNIASKPSTEEPMIEITIRQIKNIPSYLQKSQAKKDFTCGDNFYYLYTDIGKNEIGEVSINFLRDFGKIWGKIVRKDQTTPEAEANWRGIYRMPSEDWEDSLEYNGYIKKFKVNLEDTQDCIEGCYLLLSIQVSQIGDYVEDYKFYPFSIITRISPNNMAYTDIPKVVIQVNEFIVGNVDIAENERIYQFYEVWLTHDSYRVDFDFQSEVAGLYINLGGSRPTTKNSDFKLLPPGRDSILSIDKYSIIQKAQAKKIKIPNENSLQDINLVIGVWTDKTDSVDTEVFSLSVRLPSDDVTLDIVEVNTDQKILCSPRYLNDNQFRCLFMITYDDQDVELDMPLLVHAASVNQSALTYFHGSFIERDYYDHYEVETLRRMTPTSETAAYSTQRDDIDYIYTTLKSSSGQQKYYFYVNVITDKEDDVFILTSMPMFNVISQSDIEFYPNPTTEQLLSVSEDKNLILKFFTSSSLIVNIVTLGGEAEVVWADDENKIFNLRGRGDRLSLTSGVTSDKIIIRKRKTANSLTAQDDPGFVFYVSYYIRNPEVNFDEVQYGKSLELSYRETDLPVYLYSKVGAYFNDLNIAVTFMDSEIDNEGELSTSPLSVKAALAKESTVYKSKLNPELSPSLEKSVFGVYDPALKTAIVFLSSVIIRSFNIRVEDNPTLYLAMEKSEEFSDKVYSKFNIEAQFSKVNGALIPVEKTFNYGRHTGYYTNYYRLKNEKNKKYMVIELSFNSNYLEFAVNQAISRLNMTNLIIKSEKARGKIILLLDTSITKAEFIVLNIYRKDNEYRTLFLYNYAFKYININSEDEFKDYQILNNDDKLTYTESKEGDDDVIDCTFNRIDIDREKANITYFFKVVENLTLIYEEEVQTIAVSQSPYYTVYKRNPPDNSGKITLRAKGKLSNWAYLQVIAQIQQDTILEYVAYKGEVQIRKPPKSSSSGSSGPSTTVFLIVAGILLLLIGGLVVIVFIFQQRNKSLLNQVKHVSFQQNTASGNADPQLLLKNSNQSEQSQ
ncbi:MAG: hypothetical protein IJK67_00360 [Bacilli bacterium]|nr:hypothetical protein [Bacilli bacterium]